MIQMRLFESIDIWTVNYTICTGPNILAVLRMRRSFARMNDALDYEYDLLKRPSKYKDCILKHEWHFEYRKN